MLPILSAPDTVDTLDNYCDGLASRAFRSLAVVKRAHARADHLHHAAPLSTGALGVPILNPLKVRFRPNSTMVAANLGRM